MIEQKPIEKQDQGRIPPENLEFKIRIGFAFFSLCGLAAELRQIWKNLSNTEDEEARDRLIPLFSTKKGEFEVLATSIYLVADGYETEEDRTEFKENYESIASLVDPSNIEKMFSFVKFTNRMLKNADLTDLKQKNKYDYIREAL